MPEEQRQILEMLAAKQITIEEADRLLAAVAPEPRRDAPPQPRMRTERHQHTQVYARGGAATDGGAYLREMRGLGLRALQPQDLIAMKSTGVDAAFVRDLQAQGYTRLEPHDLIALKSTGVDGAYIQELRDAGLEGLEPHDLLSFKSMDISGSYVRRMRAAGFARLAPHDLIALKSQGIDAPDEDTEDGGMSEEPEGNDTPSAAPSNGETVRLLSASDTPTDE